MAKGIQSVKGNTQPEVGEINYYEVASYYPGTVLKNEQDVKWKLYVQERIGSWRELRGPEKSGKKVSYKLPEKWLGKKMMVEAYMYNPEKKALPGLIIIPKQAKIPKINNVELRYVDDKNGSTFSFMETLRVKADCVNLMGKELLFTLWEDDAKGEGHHSKNKVIATKTKKVDEKGIAVVEFPLTQALMKKAIEGEADIKQLEFYVTVEYFKDKKHATDNIEVKNPFPPVKHEVLTKPTDIPKAKGSPAERKPASKKEEKGILETIAEKGKELWDWWETPGTIKKDKIPTVQKPDGKSPAVVTEQKLEVKNCGEKYCIKKGDKSELIREINIRLAGFGGNVPTDEFTERTEKMIKQFQRDYMKVPETGKVCGNVLRAIDEFTINYKFTFDQIKCKCTSKGRSTKDVLKNRNVTNNCSGFGDGSNKNTYVKNGNTEKHHAYEYPGLHRSLLHALKAVMFYMDKINIKYKYHSISSGFRCRFHSIFISSQTTNHMGKALDILFDYGNGGRAQEKEDLDVIRKDYFEKYLNATYWTGSNNFGLETYAQGARTWVHIDVREYDSIYLDDKYFCKNSTSLNGKSILQLAVELGLTNTCSCIETYQSQKNNQASAHVDNCQDKFKKVAPIILEHEGGYKNEPAKDKGDPTNRGISWPVWQKYAKEDLGIEPTKENQRKLTEEQAKIIYRKRYWEPKGYCEVNNLKVALMVYDWSITSGGAIKEVQKLLVNEFNQIITIDGGMGKQTANALNQPQDQEKLITRLGEIRKAYYDYGASQKWFSEDYLKGLKMRVDKCLNYSL